MAGVLREGCVGRAATLPAAIPWAGRQRAEGEAAANA